MVHELEEKGYDYCTSVIMSCETIDQLNGAKNLAENFLTIHGEKAMADYLMLMNTIINKEMLIKYETGDSK
tara:strand:+ start:429 stop:641 length:213 start_codon:yes stop_codon:yes gene_type:complete